MQSVPFTPQGTGKPKSMLEAVIVLLLLVSVGPPGCQEASDPARQAAGQNAGTPVVGTGLPRLVDLGADKCIPCKMMAPVLEELKADFRGSMDVEFIDVWQDRSAAAKYGIQTIPTQVFYDPSGKELLRHVGFIAKEDILAKWKELGVDIRKSDQ